MGRDKEQGQTMKIVAVIAARMGSTRLPGKALMPIMGKPMLERMLERVSKSHAISEIVIATTTRREDDQLADFAEQMDIGCYRGSSEDVLQRINAAVKSSQADVAVELLGDNPLVHADLIDDVVEFYCNNSFDYAVSVTAEHKHASSGVARFPVGIRVEVFSPATLDKCERLAQGDYFRENTTSFIYHNPDGFDIGYYEATGRWAKLNEPDLNFAVNYGENFDLVTKIFEECYLHNPDFDLFEVVKTYYSHPEWFGLMGAPKE